MGKAELSGTGKVGMGAACAACCVVPIAVLTGALSLTALITGGVAVAAVGAVGVALWAFQRRSLGRLRARDRRSISLFGAALSIVGLALLDGSGEPGRSLLTIGVATLACAAVFVLDGVRPSMD